MRTTLNSKVRCGTAAALLTIVCWAHSAAVADILVYDENTHHQLAATAAANIDPTRVVAGSATFNGLLQSQQWDAVLIDCPSVIPSGGWQPTIDFIAAGGRVAMSFWDWDNDDGQGDPGLFAAFGVTGTTSSFSLNGNTLTDAGTTAVFQGVTIPNSDWHDHWGDDGDAFGFGVASGTLGMANLTGVTDPVMALGSSGRTIAAFLIDEAGATWIADGSGVQLWENMFRILVPEPTSVSLLAAGAVVVLARRRRRHD